jgi:WD40 repeat protein/transcriptional regulator with XRE-family HTH domain
MGSPGRKAAHIQRYSYQERDYAFGQRIRTLRTALGLTQVGLAEQLRVSERAVVDWEGGSRYPSAQHLQHVITLAVRASTFPKGREEEEIRALWKAAHQKVLLDEPWLATLLGRAPSSLSLVAALPLAPVSVQPSVPVRAASGPQIEWGEALAVSSFYGREQELATLIHWVVQEGCCMVSVLGMGGIGKSALVVRAMGALAAHFDVACFRSLRDAPSCEALLESCLQVLAPESLASLSQGLSPRLDLLLAELRSRRVLLVLDNLEALLQEGDVLVQLRPGLQAYADLLRRLSETEHQSCLLLTSREQPAALRALEGRHGPVRSLRLVGLDAAACTQLLVEHGVGGSPEERARLGQAYSGNPLALRIVAETIVDLFGGQITPFLAANTVLFGSISQLLDEQWMRLSPLEQTVLYWLAILREPVTLQDLQAVLLAPSAPEQLLEAVDGLRRRSLLERGQQVGSFTLQSVVLEYVTGRLVSTASQEIVQGRLRLLREHGLEQAQAKEYVRQTQERLLVAPLLEHLKSAGYSRAEVEERLRELLSTLRAQVEQAQGYGPANLVALLRQLRGDLRGLDLSQLALRGASLQGVELQDANLSGALLRECVWTESFDAIIAVVISRSGQYWAAGSRRGEVRVWREGGQILHLAWQAHTDLVVSLAFSPDERRLASGSFDGSVKLWDVERRALLWSGWHTNVTSWLAFSPDGGLLASSAHDGTVRLWEASLGTPLQDLPHPGPVISLAWRPDGSLLATGDVAGTIRLWERQPSGPARCVGILSEHSSWVHGLAFAPDGRSLASASYDGTVKLWEVGEARSPRVRQTLVGHTEQVQWVAWSPDGGTLASGSFDHTIRLWDVQQGRSRVALLGHSGVVHGLAFTPDSRRLLSGSEDGTLRLWEVQHGQCVRVLHGYTVSLNDVAWSPDGTKLASAGSDTVVTLWEVESGAPLKLLRGHRWTVQGVEWSPDGRRLASSGWENAIRLWEPATGTCVQILRDRDHPDTLFNGLAWSPDGERLASGTIQRGVLIWDVAAGFPRWVNRSQATWVRRVAWSPDGMRIVGGGDDGHVYLWEASDGMPLPRLAGHHGAIMSVAWSPDGSRLATSSGLGGSGELVVWDAKSGARVRDVGGHPGVASAVTWCPRSQHLISGGSDGRLRWWDMDSGECVRVREAHQGTVQALKVSPDGGRLASCGNDGVITIWDLKSGEYLRTLRRDRPYERLNITGIRGLTQAELATLRALGAIEQPAVQSP